MRRSKPHASRLSSDSAPERGRSLARLLAPVQVTLEEKPFGWRMQLDPMRLSDAIAVWAKLRPDSGARTLVCGGGDLQSLAIDLSIPVLDTFDNEQLVVDKRAVQRLAGLTRLDGGLFVLIEGPVEAHDAAAIVEADAAGRSALEAEVRAVAALRIANDRTITLDVRSREDAALFVAENLRLYLATIRHQPAAWFTAPETGLVDRLLDHSGRLSVRPIETEMYSTSVDIGICTSESVEVGPANTSLIYDLYSHTWHGD